MNPNRSCNSKRMIDASDPALGRSMPVSNVEAASPEPPPRADSVREVKPAPTQPPDAHARTLAYWLRRHEELKGDIRADGNRGLSVEENRANYERKAAKLVTVLRGLLGETVGRRVLDLGCGTGIYVPALGELGVSYTGVDLSPVALDRARERFPQGAYVQSDVADLRVEDGFDAVLAVDFLCHLTEDAAWREAIDLIAELVKRGAVAVVVERLGAERGVSQGHVLRRAVGDYKAAFARHGVQFRPAPRARDVYIASGSEEAEAARDAVRRATTPAEVHAVVKGYPNMGPARGELLYDFMREHDVATVLELGFRHGVSTCYIAAALASRGGGRMVTIDRTPTAAFSPGVEDFLERLGLRDLVHVFYEHTTYTWRLRDFLRLEPRPVFDLVFLDGAHTWEPDALAFLLAEKLLRPGGWFVFDDVDWSMANSVALRDSPTVQNLPADERHLAPVREIVEILVRSHPNIAEWRDDGKWGFARKKTLDELDPSELTWRVIGRRAAETKAHALARHPTKLNVPPDLSPSEWRDCVAGLHKK